MVRKVVQRSAVQTTSTDFGLLSGQNNIDNASSSLRPVSRLAASSVHPVETNPRFLELLEAHIVQPQIAANSERHPSSSHINKLSLRRTFEWIEKVKNGWLQSPAGQAWLAEEARAGHELNFDSPNEQEVASIWRARCRRWHERVSRMLLRAAPDTATAKRWAALTGRDPSSFIREALDPKDRIIAAGIVHQWAELIALSANVHKDGLGTPVVVRPDGAGFAIVGGERRYWACCLASIDHIPCVGGEADELTAFSLTIHENLDREDIALRSQVRAMRKFVEMSTKQPCGPGNKKIKLSFFQTEYGRSKSWCHRWRVICLLPEGCDVLAKVYNRDFTSIIEVDLAARAFLKKLKDAPKDQDEDEQVDSNSGHTQNGGTGPSTPSTPPSTPAPKPAAPLARAKVRLPGTEAGKRILSALKNTEGLNEQSQEAIDVALRGWAAAPESQRKKYLESVIEQMAQGLDYLDEVDE